MAELTRLLLALGREADETVSILSKTDDTQMSVEWTTVAEADSVASAHAGQRNVWFGVQPIDRPESGRGRASNVTGVVTLYADLDDKNAPREVSLAFINELSDILDAQPMCIVVSGGGLQPYWPIERVDPITGSVMLLWWREQVIKVAEHLGISVDTGVYDLSRILRVPGPPNVKGIYGPGGARTQLISMGGTFSTRAHVESRMALYPPAGEKARAFTRDASGWVKADRAVDGDRVYTDRQAQEYLRRPEGALETMAQTVEGAGFNVALNNAAFEVAAFVPEFLTEGQALDLVLEYLERQFPNGPDARDEATIRSGFSQSTWSARKPTETEALDPFRKHADTNDIWERQGRKIRAAGPGGAVVVREQPREGLVQCDSTGRVPGEALDDLFSDPAFPMFGHLRQFARARRVSPVAVLGNFLVRVSCAIPPYVVLPPLVGGRGSLNQFLCLVGQSGQSKGASSRAAADAVEIDFEHTAGGDFIGRGGIYSAKVGSGQGIAAQFVHRTAPDKKSGDPGRIQADRDSVLFTCNEISDLVAKAQGASTLLGTLCEVWVAEELGSSYVDPAKRLPVSAHGYRAGFILHAQPELMGPLLIDAASGGTPQRFIYLPVRDLSLPDEACEEPEPLVWTPPRTVREGQWTTIPVCAEAIAAVKAHQLAVHRGDAAHLDSHGLFLKLKLAASIDAARGFYAVTSAAWKHAEAIYDLSIYTRQGVLDSLREQRSHAVRAAGAAKGHELLAQAEVVEAEVNSKLSGRIRKVLGEQSPWTMTKAQIKRRVGGGDAFDVAFADLVSAGEIVYRDHAPEGAGRPSTVYAFASAAHAL